MCGLAGVLSRGRERVRRDELQHYVRALHHRGPDGSGIWISADGVLGLSHTRLAIIDLDDRAAQPMVGSRGSVIAFNGEIYNYRELRGDLAALGHRFRTTSDTEVVLAAYDQWGDSALERLRGMFAFAIAFPDQGRVLLARDPLGIKPLYYSVNGDAIRFASEVRALEPFCDSAVSRHALIDLLTWGNIASPLTIRDAIASLPPGHLATIDATGVHCSRWSSGAAVLDERPPPQAAGIAVEAIRESTRMHLEADVEVGVFLSSGVDSTVLASLCSHYSSTPITTITVRNPDSDESVAAAEFARSIGANHLTVEFSDADMASHLAEAVLSLDQPSLDGINSFFVARAAREAGLKVAISGVGGDELFGGYSTFSRLPRLHRLSSFARLLPDPGTSVRRQHEVSHWDRTTFRGRANWLAAYLRHDWGPYLIARGVMPPHDVARLLDVSLATVVDRISDRLDMSSYSGSDNWVSRIEMDQYLQPQLLRDIDAASMRSSVEVRTPLVDAALYGQLAPIPPSDRLRQPSKALLRSASFDPPATTAKSRSKKGFTVPIAHWMRSGSIDLNQDVPPELNRNMSQQMVRESLDGVRPWSHGWLIHILCEVSSMPIIR